MTNILVYIKDRDGYKIEVDLERSQNTGEYLEGPEAGSEVVLDDSKAQQALKRYQEIIDETFFELVSD